MADALRRTGRYLLHGESRTGRRRVPLLASFGIMSLVLILALGVVLAIQIQNQVARRSVAQLTKTTQSAIALTVNTVASGLTYGRAGTSPTPQQQQAQAGLITSASRVLVGNSDVVAVDAVLANGTVIGGWGSPPVGSKLASTPGFRAALLGGSEVQTLPADAANVTLNERRLLRHYGDLLVSQQGVRLTPRGPILAVVSAYTPLGPTRHQAGMDVRSIVVFLAVGLLVFWAVLFRLVLGASRALTRQSKVNEHQATHDSLTGLANRTLLRDRTERAILASRRSGHHVGLILMDLDRFKVINDTLGHPYGDLLLKQIGPRLREHLRDADTIARIGGDEFVVMLPDLRSSHAALAVAEKLVLALKEPFLLDGVMVDSGSSAGVVTTPGDGSDFDELFQHADVAMYVAKEGDREVVQYDALLDINDPARLSLLADLRMAIAQPEQILVYYQPQADLATGRIVGAEALVRWQHPVHRLLSPDAFIPIAERTGIIRPLTWCILRKALEDNRKWAEDGLELQVSVNISPRCLLDPGFGDEVGRLLVEIGVPAERLTLELTETAIMSDPELALTVLQELADRGIQLSIDDFGTGYSSLAYLKNLPVSELKIDRAFITNLETDLSDEAIVRSCLELARNLNLTVVAEGVETREVWLHLTDFGCPAGQGYFLARPMPVADFTRWLSGCHGVFAMQGSPAGS